jgi:hypothetical protein
MAQAASSFMASTIQPMLDELAEQDQDDLVERTKQGITKIPIHRASPPQETTPASLRVVGLMTTRQWAASFAGW